MPFARQGYAPGLVTGWYGESLRELGPLRCRARVTPPPSRSSMELRQEGNAEAAVAVITVR